MDFLLNSACLITQSSKTCSLRAGSGASTEPRNRATRPRGCRHQYHRRPT